MGDITCSESLDRTAPSTATGNFQVTYNAIGTSGAWGASIEDSVSGGCAFPSGSTTYKTVMLSEDGNSKTITMTSPSSGTCSFTNGNYMFGECAIVNMANDAVTIGTSTQTCSAQGGTCCSSGQTCSGTTASSSDCGTICCTYGTCVTSCTDTTWTPATSTICSGISFTQTSNCGSTRSSTGTMDCSGSCTQSLDRTAPSTANPSSTFQVTYNAIGTSGAWGASIEDSVSGGCAFPSGSTTYKTVMLSEDGNSKIITMTSPSSGTCSFTGDYKFGECAIVNMANDAVTFSGVCTPNCGGNVCGTNGCGGVCGTCDVGTSCSGGICVTDIPSCTYSAWTTCSEGCNQTRTITSGTACVGKLTQTCSGGDCPVTCIDFIQKKDSSGECVTNTGSIILIIVGLFAFKMFSN